MVAVYADASPETAAAIDRDFLDFATRCGRTEYEVEYLLVVARVAR